MRGKQKHYIVQCGSVWSLTHVAYYQFLGAGFYGREWNLDKYGKRLKKLPKGLSLEGESRLRYIEPLDWENQDYHEEILRFEKLYPKETYRALGRIVD